MLINPMVRLRAIFASLSRRRAGVGGWGKSQGAADGLPSVKPAKLALRPPVDMLPTFVSSLRPPEGGRPERSKQTGWMTPPAPPVVNPVRRPPTRTGCVANLAWSVSACEKFYCAARVWSCDAHRTLSTAALLEPSSGRSLRIFSQAPRPGRPRGGLNGTVLPRSSPSAPRWTTGHPGWFALRSRSSRCPLRAGASLR